MMLARAAGVLLLVALAAGANTDGVVQLLARQLLLQQHTNENRVRSTGGSGLTEVRQYGGGTRTFHDATYVNSGAANIHNHADTKYTVGMGEIAAVLNGVEFWTRHNDYQLRSPSKTSNSYNRVDYIEPAAVPQAVLNKPTVAEQVEEMRLWFKAWQEQDYSVRDYRPFFFPVMSYLEGTWIKDHGELKEPFASDRHHIDAKTWAELHDKSRFLSMSGDKNLQENLAQLPSRITKMVGENATLPETANFEYRIAAIKLDRDVPLNRLRMSKEMQTQMLKYPQAKTQVEISQTRGARFDLNAKDSDNWYEGRVNFELIDEFMEQVPGKDNFNANIINYPVGQLAKHYVRTNETLNTGYYSRYYAVESKDASGRQRRKRGFNDGAMWGARTTQEKVAGLELDDGYGPVSCPLEDSCNKYIVSKIRTYMNLRHMKADNGLWSPAGPNDGKDPTGWVGTGGVTDDDIWKLAAWEASGSGIKDCPNHDRAKNFRDDKNYIRDEYIQCRHKVKSEFWDRYRGTSAESAQAAGKIVEPEPKDPSCGPLMPDILADKKVWAQCPRDKSEQKWSWAIPLEIIFVNPLLNWNPYNLTYWPNAQRNKVTEGGRNGDLEDPAKAFNGNSRNSMYRTPVEFFSGGDANPDAADTVKQQVGVLDQEGKIRKVAASGTWIILPPISGVGDYVRQRYPIFPLHHQGSPIWKELKALEAVQLTGDPGMVSKVREEALGVSFELSFANGHVHTLTIDGHDLVTKLQNDGDQDTFISSLNNGHEHSVTIKRVSGSQFEMVEMDPPEPHRLIAQGSVATVQDTEVTQTGLNTAPSSTSSWGWGSNNGQWGHGQWGHGQWGHGQWGGKGGGGGGLSANHSELVDKLIVSTQALKERVAQLETQLSAQSSCAELGEMKGMLQSLTQAVASAK